MTSSPTLISAVDDFFINTDMISCDFFSLTLISAVGDYFISTDISRVDDYFINTDTYIQVFRMLLTIKIP